MITKKIIKINKSKKKFTDYILDIILIEINPEIDKIYNFLDISKDVINKEQKFLNLTYKNKSIYILHYPSTSNIWIY